MSQNPSFLLYYIYCAWNILCGRYDTIKLSFMIAGHTKFLPDWCFGLLKQKLRRCRVDCLDDLVEVVESSADVNFAQLVGAQSGETLVQMYDWASHFQPYFRTLHGIKKHHHFLFSKSAPHIVRIQQYMYSDTTKAEYPLLSDTTWIPSIDKLPQIITPTGLSAERQLYLYQKIREFNLPRRDT